MDRSLAIPRLVLVCAALCATVACSSASKYDAATQGSATSTTDPYGTLTGDSGTTGPNNVPVFYAITGNLALVSEGIDPALSTVEVDYRNAEGESLCSGIRNVLTATPVVNTDADLPLHGWWSVDLDLSPCGDFGPDNLMLGIGDWDPQLEAAAAAQNLTGPDLYSLYLQHDIADPVYVFGVTGTSEQFSATPPALTAPPLPDGVYQLRTLLLLPVIAS